MDIEADPREQHGPKYPETDQDGLSASILPAYSVASKSESYAENKPKQVSVLIWLRRHGGSVRLVHCAERQMRGLARRACGCLPQPLL